MEFIRIIHQHHYDPDKKRFTSLAFKPSSDGSGISVIAANCIVQKGARICEHIEKYYKSVSGIPPIFWSFDSKILPERCEFIQQTSESGDVCHYNLVGLSAKEAGYIFKQQDLSVFSICRSDGNYQPLKISDMATGSDFVNVFA
jgi:hypothetical protein